MCVKGKADVDEILRMRKTCLAAKGLIVFNRTGNTQLRFWSDLIQDELPASDFILLAIIYMYIDEVKQCHNKQLFISL